MFIREDSVFAWKKSFIFKDKRKAHNNIIQRETNFWPDIYTPTSSLPLLCLQLQPAGLSPAGNHPHQGPQHSVCVCVCVVYMCVCVVYTCVCVCGVYMCVWCIHVCVCGVCVSACMRVCACVSACRCVYTAEGYGCRWRHTALPHWKQSSVTLSVFWSWPMCMMSK